MLQFLCLHDGRVTARQRSSTTPLFFDAGTPINLSKNKKKRTCVSRVCNPKHKKGFETYFQCIGEATSTVETESLAVNLQVSGCANSEESGLQQTFRRHNTKCRVLGLVFLLNVNRHAHNEDRNHIQE